MKKFFESFLNSLQYQVYVVGGALGGMFLTKGLDENQFREVALGIAIIIVYLVLAIFHSNCKD